MSVFSRNVDLLWTLGVEGQGDVAQGADITGGRLCGDGLPLAAVLVRLKDEALLLGLDLLGGGRPDHGPVLVELILQPLDQLILLIQLQLQLVDQGVSLPQLLNLLLKGILKVPQGAHWSCGGVLRSSQGYSGFFGGSSVVPRFPLNLGVCIRILKVLKSWGSQGLPLSSDSVRVLGVPSVGNIKVYKHNPSQSLCGL